MRMGWTTQNEATGADGFLLEGDASFAAEIVWLSSSGCPDTGKAKLVSVEITGRAESVTTAVVTARMARWLENETDTEPIERAT
jgi:hypothetical protein